MAERILRGQTASSGLAAGPVLVLNRSTGNDEPLPLSIILAARDMTPDRILAEDWTLGGAVLLTVGSPTFHVAVVAPSHGVAMIVGLGATQRR